MVELYRPLRALRNTRTALAICQQCRQKRSASSITPLVSHDPDGDVIQDSTLGIESLPENLAAEFDPVAKAKARKGPLPASR